ncbi:hypothetical protein, partial [Streptomyces sp. SID14478]|uniref:hypothetical protein n=1 Tax=Streptomyces sp. SID14478 TaxID=2706073 RepID=UPI001940E8F8
SASPTTPTPPPAPVPASARPALDGERPLRRGSPRAWRGPSLAVLLLCIAAAAASAGLHGADLRRGPVPELA